MRSSGEQPRIREPAEALRSYFRLYPPAGLVAAFLFGSHARGAAHAESDVDVAVLLAREAYLALEAPLETRARLTAELMHATGSERVDLLWMNETPPPLNKEILEDGVTICSVDREALAEFRFYTLSRAADLKPWLDRWRREGMLRAAAATAPPQHHGSGQGATHR